MTKGHLHQHIPKTLENAGEFRMFIYELTESKIFSVSILFVILLNTVILVIQTDEAFSVKAGWCSFFQFVPYLVWVIRTSLKFYNTCLAWENIGGHKRAFNSWDSESPFFDLLCNDGPRNDEIAFLLIMNSMRFSSTSFDEASFGSSTPNSQQRWLKDKKISGKILNRR